MGQLVLTKFASQVATVRPTFGFSFWNLQPTARAVSYALCFANDDVLLNQVNSIWAWQFIVGPAIHREESENGRGNMFGYWPEPTYLTAGGVSRPTPPARDMSPSGLTFRRHTAYFPSPSGPTFWLPSMRSRNNNSGQNRPPVHVPQSSEPPRVIGRA